jgi:hypothetical protein
LAAEQAGDLNIEAAKSLAMIMAPPAKAASSCAARCPDSGIDDNWSNKT